MVIEEGIGFSMNAVNDILEKIHIDYIKFVGSATGAAGNQVVLKDAYAKQGTGGRIFHTIAAGANHMDQQFIGKYFDKIILNTFDDASGVLYIATKFTNEK